MIRRRDLQQGRKRVTSALKKRELRIADISISIAELHLDHLPTDFGDAIRVPYGGLTKERCSEGVASGPRDGEASEWGLEAMVEWVDEGAPGLWR